MLPSQGVLEDVFRPINIDWIESRQTVLVVVATSDPPHRSQSRLVTSSMVGNVRNHGKTADECHTSPLPGVTYFITVTHFPQGRLVRGKNFERKHWSDRSLDYGNGLVILQAMLPLCVRILETPSIHASVIRCAGECISTDQHWLKQSYMSSFSRQAY